MALLLLLPLLLAFGAMYVGRKRRIGDDPHCRRCNYLLHGLTSERCPECGATLSPAAIVRGERRRNWPAFLIGWTLLGLSGIGLLLDGFDRLQGINWYQFEPTYFVLRDLNSTTPATVQSAWTELTRRDAAGQLSAKSRDRLVRFALAQQAKAASPFIGLDTDTVNYLGVRFLAGDLPKDQQTKFFEQTVRLKLLVRPQVILPDRVPYLAVHDGVGPTGNTFWVKVSDVGASIDGKLLQGNGGGYSCYSGFSGGSTGSSLKCPGVGKHAVAITMRVEVFNGVFDTPSTQLYRADRTMTANFEVLPTAPPGFVQPIFDPRLAAAMKLALKPTSFRYDAKSRTLDGQIDISNPPINFAFDVFARFGGHEWSLGAVTYKANSGLSGYSFGGEVKSPVPATIDLILRPSEKVARNTVDLQSFWNQEIVFSDVPVTTR